MRVNMNIIMVIISGKRQKLLQKAARWPFGVCGRGVGSNSTQCIIFQKWVHKKCSCVNGSMFKVMKSLICTGCLNSVSSAGCANVDIGASANLELVCKFCYLGDILSVNGNADAAVEVRIRIGWNKFTKLLPLLINKNISSIEKDCTADVCKVACCMK